MHYSHHRKRGRPRRNEGIPKRQYKDKGTPELQVKRQLGITADPLDRCFEKGLISEDAHLAGLRLRVYYYRTFGSPHATSYDWCEVASHIQDEYPEELLEYAGHYLREAFVMLKRIGAYKPVVDLCVYGIIPPYLEAKYRPKLSYAKELTLCKEGLEELTKVFKKKFHQLGAFP